VRLSDGLKGRLLAATTRNEKVVTDGVKALSTEAEPKAGAGFGACMAPVFRAVADGSASLKTNLKAAELVEAAARGR
jgi:gamma-glutamyl:cysteine ligase YbdK (ATP-grasp superfamily)